eukprot:m.230926 g.230926  ORF g.230926 m.230926 type:complete len:395 (-) comp12134_c0_seq1:161-1345(-)
MSKQMMEGVSSTSSARPRPQELAFNAMAYALQQQQQQMWYNRQAMNFPAGRAPAEPTSAASTTPATTAGMTQPATTASVVLPSGQGFPTGTNPMMNPYASAFPQGFPVMPPFAPGGPWPFMGLPGFFNPQLAQLAASQMAGIPVSMAAAVAAAQAAGCSTTSASLSASRQVPLALNAPALSPPSAVPRSRSASSPTPKIEAIDDDARIPTIQAGGKRCSSCGTSNTPVWREVEHVTLCNACGIRWRRTGLACASCKYVPRAHQIRQKSCSRCGKPSKFLPCMSPGGSAKKARRAPSQSPQPIRKQERLSSDEEDDETPIDEDEQLLDDSDDEYAPPRAGRAGAVRVPQVPVTVTLPTPSFTSDVELAAAEKEATDVLKANFNSSSLHILANVAE